jgi:hypothetical protein
VPALISGSSGTTVDKVPSPAKGIAGEGTLLLRLLRFFGGAIYTAART